MSKKLSTLNVFQETAGLIVHEMSHLLKANEDQANEIQNLFLNDIKNISPEMIAINLEYLVDDSGKGKVFETILPTTFWEKDPSNYLKFKDCFAWMKDLVRLKEVINNQPQGVILFTNPVIMKLYQPQFAKLAVIQLFVSAHDKNVSAIERKASHDLLEKLFFDKDEKTAGEINRVLGITTTSNHDLVTIKKPREWNDISLLLVEMRTYLYSTQNDISNIKGFSLDVYEIN